jgi:hypothetical protein
MDVLTEIGTYLQSHSVGTLGTDIWLGEMQPTPDDSIGLFETPGGTPELHDRTDYPSLQVRVRSATYAAGQARIETIYNLLNGLHETDLSGTRYHLIAAKQRPFSLGSVDRERHEFACNFRLIVRNAARTPPSGQ